MGGDQRLHSVMAVGQGTDAYVHLVSWRPTATGESEVVHSTHFQPLLAALDWVSVGRPGGKGDRTGTPVVSVDDQGRAHIFVRDPDGGSVCAPRSRRAVGVRGVTSRVRISRTISRPRWTGRAA